MATHRSGRATDTAYTRPTAGIPGPDSPEIPGLGLLLGGLVYLGRAVPILRVKKIERSLAYAKGCSPDFLASLARTLRCAACGYDLRGHDSAADEVRCPECGEIA